MCFVLNKLCFLLCMFLFARKTLQDLLSVHTIRWVRCISRNQNIDIFSVGWSDRKQHHKEYIGLVPCNPSWFRWRLKQTTRINKADGFLQTFSYIWCSSAYRACRIDRSCRHIGCSWNLHFHNKVLPRQVRRVQPYRFHPSRSTRLDTDRNLFDTSSIWDRDKV